jgi:NodT family efflux transporter outer membrane factor (OMF) lipoprotein
MPINPDLRPTARPLALLLSAVALATLSACANYSGIDPVAKPLDASTLGLKNPAAPPADNAGSSEWWLGLGDAQLQTLIQKAQENSPGLRATQARLARAQAANALVKSAGGPSLNAELDVTRQLFSANSIYPPPFGGSAYEMGTLQANAAWEFDFFGKNSAALAASVGQIGAVQADLQAARGLLAANVARSYFQLVRIEAQLALAQRNLAQRVQIKQLTLDRLHAGLDTQLELQQSDSALPDMRLQIEILNEQKALTLNALAALTAQPVQALALQPPALATLAVPQLPSTLPLNLLGQRADIAAARWRIEAGMQDVKSAKAEFYPNIDLVGFAGYSSIGWDKLLNSDSLNWGVGPAIHLPLFDSGRLRAMLSGKTADLDSAIESYNAQVIEAVHEVSDQLSISKAVQRQQTEQAAAQASAEKAYQIAVDRYQAGLGNYLNVLSAETPLLAQRRQGIDLAARALDTQVQLLHAMGSATAAPAQP